MDLNHGPSGYEPDELPGCSTPQQVRQAIVESSSRSQAIPRVRRKTVVLAENFADRGPVLDSRLALRGVGLEESQRVG